MAFDAEYKEYFLRNKKVTSGTKPDQEVSYPVEESVKGVSKFNRFLKLNFPTEGIYKKLFASLTFKLNKEDTASLTVQGLVKKATDANSSARTSNASNDYAAAVLPHQLPEVVLATDGSDVVEGSVIEAGGLALSKIKRTLAGLFRRNYLLAVNPDKSIEIDGTSKKVQLVGDSLTPGNSKYYGTDGVGAKGFHDVDLPVRKFLVVDFSSSNAVPASIGAGANLFEFDLLANTKYIFRARFWVLLDGTGGATINLNNIGGLTETDLRYQIRYSDDTTDAFEYNIRRKQFNQNDAFTGFTQGFIEIEGAIHTNVAGKLAFEFSQAGASGTSKVESCSFVEVMKSGT